MTEKTRTVVVIERHEQTIIRRSGRRVSAQLVIPSPTAPIQEKRKTLGRWWKAVALTSATVLAPWSRRLKTRADERNNRLS